jgi:hypothetical protein
MHLIVMIVITTVLVINGINKDGVINNKVINNHKQLRWIILITIIIDTITITITITIIIDKIMVKKEILELLIINNIIKSLMVQIR